MHDAVLGRANFDPGEHVLSRNLPFGTYGQIGADRGELLAGLGAQILVQLEDLQLGLGDLVLAFSNRGGQLAAIALGPGEIALQGNHPCKLNQVFLPEGLHALQLFPNPFKLIALGGRLRLKTDDFLPKLGDPLPQLRPLSIGGRPPNIEQALLPRQKQRNAWVHAAFDQ